MSLLPEYKTVIIDEAHKLIGVSQQMYGANICQNEINNIIKKVLPKNGTTRAKKISKKLCNEVLKYNKLLFEELINQISKELYGSNTEKFKTIITSRATMLLKRMIVNSSDLLRNISYKDRKLQSDIKRLIENMKVFIKADNIYWLEKPFAKGQCTFLSIPKNLNEEICKDLWSMDKSMLLTSGTIAVNGDFNYMKKELGLDIISGNKIVEISKGSPFDFKENCMMYISNNVPFPNSDDENYIKKVTNEIYKLIKASNGHAMVLFTSYKPLRKVYKNLSEQITDIPLIEMSRGRSSAVLEFKESKNGVLFATGSMWEGVNIPGDILSHLIIVKLPFPIPDPISEYEKTLYRDMDHYRNSVLIPKMLIKLRQGVGRLIRSEADTGVISILDIRASNKRKYHQEIINALPECVVTEEIDEIEIFIKNKKDKTYFE
jgi:ATP-dependent DNA helicase DinG